MTFSEFFSKACDGRTPYPYQTAFAESSSLPELLNVPTGVGKTATAILGWLYRRRFHQDTKINESTPRRLVYCLPMRTLVEQTCDCAKAWLKALKLSDKVGVHLLMGGEDNSNWDEFPEQDAILIGTQDMLLSRALNRGYGMSRYRWPMHFGLLNNDCLWVMDETQLMGVGLTTSAQLQGLRSKLKTYGATHSLWMSATLDTSPIRTVDHQEPSDGFSRIGLENADRKHSQVKKRLDAKKGLEKAAFVLSSESEKRSYAKDLVAAVRNAHRPGTLTLVVMNRVLRAQQLFRELENLTKPKTKPSPLDAELALIHSRFRPDDRKVHEQSLFSSTIPDAGRIVVATQAIEAGVDVSATTMFTELAPWPYLVQRFGRCNRGGEVVDAQVIWIDTLLKGDKDNAALPYEANELQKSRDFLTALKDVGPRTLSQIQDERPPAIFHTLRRKDLLDLWDTTPDLAGNDLDISRYIREGDDTDVQVFWRDVDEEFPSDLIPAPMRSELCSVAIGRISDFLAKLKKTNKQFALIFKPLENENKWRPIEPDDVRPGMVLLLAPQMGGYSDQVGWTGDSSDKPTLHPPVAGEPVEAIEDGSNLRSSQWTTLPKHLDRVVAEAAKFKKAFKACLEDIPWDAITTAAKWHDVGKAHSAFQNMILRGVTDAVDRRTKLWAKSSGSRSGRPRYFAKDDETDERIGFRHELASALVWLAHGNNDPHVNLIAFLIAAHHGKVRASIRSFPNENPPHNSTLKFARGIRDGDVIPSIDFGDGHNVPPTTLNLELMELGNSATGSSWLARVINLRDDQELGPFRLCFLEMLLRVADWRGSNTGEITNDE